MTDVTWILLANFFLCGSQADRFAMAGSKGSAKKIETPPYRDRMELRSMSRRPPPPYVEADSLKNLNSINDSTSKQQNGSTTIIIRSGCAKFPRCRCISLCTCGLLTILLTVVLVKIVFPYPLHASCVIKWNFGEPCTEIMQKLRWQILGWSSCANCGPRGSRCLYALKELRPDESNVIRALHLAPNMKTVETMQIAFKEVNKTCMATGESVSNEWFRIFDYGTNYCNLRNLVTSIGSNESPRFLELTSNAVCTQYNMAVCN